MPGGQSALDLRHPDGRRLRIIPQRTFGSAGNGFGSLSFSQIPDITVELVDADGRARLLVLDPKYKVRDSNGTVGPKKDDIDKMHAYRDAIIDRMTGQRVVHHAAILYPGPAVSFGDQVSAIETCPLRPGIAAAAIANLLRALMPENRPQHPAMSWKDRSLAV